MSEYSKHFIELAAKYPILDLPLFTLTENEVEQKLSKYPISKYPRSFVDFLTVFGDKIWEMQFSYFNSSSQDLWRPEIDYYLEVSYPYFMLDEYLDEYVVFFPLNGDADPAVYFCGNYTDDKGEDARGIKIRETNLTVFLEKYYLYRYASFQNRLAGRVELRERVEQAKAILKPLYETANALMSPHIADDNMDLALHWVKCLHKEIFYNPYQLRYHSDFSKWEVEAIKYNNLVIEYLLPIQPDFQKINPIQAPVLDNLLIGFVNFEQTIRWVAAAPDATVKKPSPAAQDAAKEERDITDFLL